MLTLQIKGPRHRSQLLELRQLVGENRLYSKGTVPSLFVDYRRRSEAHLVLVALNHLHGVKARILGDG